MYRIANLVRTTIPRAVPVYNKASGVPQWVQSCVCLAGKNGAQCDENGGCGVGYACDLEDCFCRKSLCSGSLAVASVIAVDAQYGPEVREFSGTCAAVTTQSSHAQHVIDFDSQVMHTLDLGGQMPAGLNASADMGTLTWQDDETGAVVGSWDGTSIFAIKKPIHQLILDTNIIDDSTLAILKGMAALKGVNCATTGDPMTHMRCFDFIGASIMHLPQRKSCHR